jgi:hypothetical protein
MTLRSRLDRLQRTATFGPKTYVVSALEVEWGNTPPGTIRPWRNGKRANLYVPSK